MSLVAACGLLGASASCAYTLLVALMLLAAAGAPLPATAALIVIGSSTARAMGPSFPLLSLWGTAAATSGDLLDYGLGRLSSRVLHAWLHRPLSWMLRAAAAGRGNM